jgi:indolepyruvate ferredoxin oxidoreductase
VHFRAGTGVVLNRAEMPTGDLVLHRDADLRISQREKLIRKTVGDANVFGMDANWFTERLIGDAVFANMMLLGASFQLGLVPVSELALKQAITLNGVAIENNAAAFDLGRVMIATPDALRGFAPETSPVPETLGSVVDYRAEFLTDFQDKAYAERYRTRIARLHDALPTNQRDALAILAAKSLFKLMAYKDEYEVARLFTRTDFNDAVESQFEGDYRLHYHLAPPLLSFRRDARGRPLKRQFGPWIYPLLRMLAGMKRLRGTRVDPFAHSSDRRLDRSLLKWFETVMSHVESRFDPAVAQQLLSAPMDIRGYGPVRHQASDSVRAETDAIMAAGKHSSL